MRAISALAVPAVLALAGAVPAAAQDKEKTGPVDAVVRMDGGQAKPLAGGKIEAADWDTVVYVRDGRKTNVPAADVVDVRWGDAPSDWEPAVRALQARDGDTARKGFEACIAAKDAIPSLRDWVREFANVGLGESWLLVGAANPKAADKAADAFAAARAANPRSMWTDRIFLGLAEAELLRGRPDAAVRAADELAAAAKTAKRSAWELDAYLLKGRAAEKAQNFAAAVTAYDDAIRFAEGVVGSEKSETARARLRQVGLDAAVRRGWVLVAKGEASKSAADFEAARSYFDGLASRNPGAPAVLGALSNAHGIAKLHAGDVKAALRTFQETEVQWFGSTAEVARSLWYQAECAKRLGDEKQRNDRLKDLKEMYPTSEWARRAD